MKTIHFVTGSNQESHIDYIRQKGENPYSIQDASLDSNLSLFKLSIEDALSKNEQVYIEAQQLTADIVSFVVKLLKSENIQLVSYFLLNKLPLENFLDSERNFGLFLELPHRTIYFDYFPKI